MADRRGRLDTPAEARRVPAIRYDAEAFGRSTERIARFLGTGRYLIIQTVFVVVWILINTLPGLHHFDKYAFLFLTLILSLQAAYSAPLILLAQNRQDDRDRVNLDQDREQFQQEQANIEYLARELAAVRLALGEVVTRDFLRSELARAQNPESRKSDARKQDARKGSRQESSGQKL